MTQKVYYYHLYLIGNKEPIELSQEQGQKLAIILAQNNLPKFVYINDDILATSCIQALRKIEEETRINSMGYPETFDEGEERELTMSEIETQKKYLDFKETLKLKHNAKALPKMQVSL